LENKEQCLKYFNLYDEDKDGKISFQNLKKVAIEIGETMSGENYSHYL
jgi:centrin-1